MNKANYELFNLILESDTVKLHSMNTFIFCHYIILMLLSFVVVESISFTVDYSTLV
jgi:hypothetical protein